jgi:hypothetical protein
MNPELEQEVANLRALNLTPKQIARKLGLRPSEVTAIIQNQAEKLSQESDKKGGLPPIAKCYANRNCIQNLFPSQSQGSTGFENANKDNLDIGVDGLGMVFVARQVSNRFRVCTYLVDYWCLGVKDVIGPRQMDRTKYEVFLSNVYHMYPEGYAEITLQQAQDIVLGAIEYAASLGLKPHADFAATREHLGEWSGQTDIQFGRDGKPCFIAGPYDNVNMIMRTLSQTSQENNFNYIVPIDNDNETDLSDW